MFVKTGDNVEIISGDDKGKQGTVIQALPRENKVIVKGVNVVKKHSKPTNTQPQGGIIDVERPINATNVKIVKGSAKKTSTAKKSTKSTDKKEDK
ncbi:50S ribosomal protein L24 [Companilactobacillus mishanensis]|uniref:Large ribosomal subunit protein uL24 n=1 Tax=Companilactobacillus mishanensis TaxID=2486008 RepID=A0A5P0ZHF6_9LACO|nr:50S ribosomal protein L24 [Companilactobacillus mishanensis]MQS44903.1 50S ribosomal protein L24 [Companilactobacillus mishanensis]MQS52418.1 50S ribosomal protein L24 [Companilactobacillus mishanensis]MQS89418.1 50S ribosomal protein L24 [Companilactobacillus mishanensis]